MANPVTHIILALQILHLLPPSVDHKAFLVGTVFPDIRYLAQIAREKTHIEPVSLDAVMLEPSSFRAGMLFHNLVDLIRIEQLEHHFYDRSKLDQYTPLYIKLFPLMQKTAEDNVLYTKTENWEEIISYFDTIYQEELDFGVSEETAQTWHTLIQTYIKQQTSTAAIAEFVVGNIFENIEQFDPCVAFHNLIQSSEFQEKVELFYKNFPQYAREFGSEK